MISKLEIYLKKQTDFNVAGVCLNFQSYFENDKINTEDKFQT